MPGKDPHRPQGKALDAEHMAHTYAAKDVPRQAPSGKEMMDSDRRNMEMRGGSSRFSAEDQVGGSRPRVESRVKGAIDEREAREG